MLNNKHLQTFIYFALILCIKFQGRYCNLFPKLEFVTSSLPIPYVFATD